MIVALVGAGAAIIAAVLGVLVSKWLQDPARPEVLVDTLRVSPTPIPSGSIAQVNHELLDEIISSPFQLGDVEKQPFDEVSQQEKYIPYLLSVQDDIRTQVELRLPHLSEIVKKLASYLSVGDFDRFERLWAEDQVALWSILEGMAIRKELSVDQLNVDIDDDAKLAREIKRVESTWVVDLPGGLAIALPSFERQGPAKDISMMLAGRTARALAYRQRSVLEKLVNSLDSQSTVLLGPLKNLQHDVDAELRQYNRIYIAGLISNAGQSPFSVLAHGTLTINAKDYPESDEDSGTNPSEITKIPSDVKVQLVIDDAEGPLSVPAGSTIRFNAVTSRLVQSIPHYRGLMAAFSGGERTCKLYLEIVGVGRARARSIHSRLLFREIRGGKALFILIRTPASSVTVTRSYRG